MKRLFLYSFIALTLLSCKTVQFVPAYDNAVVEDVETGKLLTEALYNQMIESGDRSYSLFEEKYQMLSAHIDGIIAKEKARPKSGDLVKISSNIKSMFVKYSSDHKKRIELTKSELTIYKLYLMPHWKALLNAEKSLK